MITYVVRNESKKHLKIGKTNNLINRFNNLKTSNFEKLTIVGYFEKDIESELHSQFSDFRVNGEWFKYSILKQLILTEGFVKYIPKEKNPISLKINLNEIIFRKLDSCSRDLIYYILLNIKEEKVKLVYSDVMKVLLVSKPTVSKAIKQLVDNGIILKINQSTFWVNMCIVKTINKKQGE